MILSIVAAPAAASAEGLSVEALLQRVLPSVARIVSDDDANPDTESVGSGVVLVHSAGAVDVLTAAHVIKSKRPPVIHFANLPKGKRGSAVKLDAKVDLAMVRIDGADVPALPLAREVRRGLGVAVIGFPGYEYQFDIQPRLSDGVVSAVDEQTGLFEHDAVTDEGNSGGPIVDLSSGALVGVVEGEPSPGDYVGISVTRIRQFMNSLH